MCTLTWLITPEGYEVFFNRDEQKIRPQAIPPTWDPILKAIYPIDTQGGGTWITLTQRGEVFCLLNNYQAVKHFSAASPALSRGSIIPTILKLDGPIDARAQALPLTRLAPFLLCYFPANVQDDRDIQVVSWDGLNLTTQTAVSPITSSGVMLKEVRRCRQESYQRIDGHRQGHLTYHQSHYGHPSAHSVCMHREDANTVSLSHIMVNAATMRFDYYSGSPCQNMTPTALMLS